MRRIYFIPLLIFALGLSLIVASTSSGTEVSLLGLSLMAPVVRGLGLIVIIFSLIAFLAAYGSTLPEKQRTATPAPVGDRQTSREEPAAKRELAPRV